MSDKKNEKVNTVAKETLDQAPVKEPVVEVMPEPVLETDAFMVVNKVSMDNCVQTTKAMNVGELGVMVLVCTEGANGMAKTSCFVPGGAVYNKQGTVMLGKR